MQIVIEISEEIYNELKLNLIPHGSIEEEMIVDAVKNGTPLPKGHGDLIDGDVLLSDLAQLCYDESSLADNPYIENPHIDSIIDVVENSRTIIPADNIIKCPNCGIEQYNDNEYCMDCGAKLEGGK